MTAIRQAVITAYRQDGWSPQRFGFL